MANYDAPSIMLHRYYNVLVLMCSAFIAPNIALHTSGNHSSFVSFNKAASPDIIKECAGNC